MSTLPTQVEQFLFSRLDKAKHYREGVVACCPYHDEHTPSFFVYYADSLDDWFYKCHGCNKSGVLRTLIKWLHGPFEQLKEIKHDFNKKPKQDFILTYLPDLTVGLPEVYDYFLSRGISPYICQHAQLKFDFAQRAGVIPIYSRGQYKGSITRFVEEGVKPKYRIQGGAALSDTVYGYDWCDKTKPTVIVEGPIDALCLWTFGMQAVALITGKQWKGKLSTLQKLERPILLPDNGDSQSFKLFSELHRELRAKATLAILPRAFKDFNDYALRAKRAEVLEWISALSLQ